MTETSKAVFVSYASEDGEAASRIASALRAAGLEVWFDQSELRGGDAWDRQIRKQIRECALFVPIISAQSEARIEGYFRREWRLAVERTQDMADGTPFLVPVNIDNTHDASARVPDQFHHVHWTRLLNGVTPPAFVERVSRLLSSDKPDVHMHSSPDRGALTSPAGASAQRVRKGRTVRVRYALWATIAAAILGSGYLADRFLIAKQSAAPLAVTAAPAIAAKSAKAERSIAVLPFVDMSEKHDQEYFSDGLSEELIDRLSRSATLRVISRTSCFYFKGKQATVSEIAKTLSVTHVLEGSVRKSGNSLRITVQLIRASDGIDLWSRTYDRTLRDIFKLQDEIASAVDRELEIAIWNSSESSSLHSPKPAAYDLVLLAKADRSFNVESFERSIKYYREAIALDPDYALAWAGLASVLSGKEQLANPEETKVLQEQARDAAAKALAIDPNLAAAHVVSGVVREDTGDWDGAEIEYEKANALKPGSGDFYLVFLRTFRYGALNQAIDFYQTALLRDPLDATYFTKLGQALRNSGRFEEAAIAFRRVIEIEPDFNSEHEELARTLLRLGKQQEALSEAEREPDKSERAALHALIFWDMGHQAEADVALQELKATSNDGGQAAVAEVLAHRGDTNAAFEWLDQAIRKNDAMLKYYIKTDLEFAPLRSDARYKTLLHKLNLPE